MATFTADIQPYDLAVFSTFEAGLGWELDKDRCALLVHDMLPYYLSVLPAAQQEAVTTNAGRLVAAARSCEVPVLASAPRPASEPAQRGLGGRLWGIGPTPAEAATSAVPELQDGPVAWVAKRSVSAFYATDLEVELRRLGRDQLDIAEVFASGGVVATTFDALARDIEVFVVADAVGDDDRTLHEAALTQVARSTGQVIPAARVLETLV